MSWSLRTAVLACVVCGCGAADNSVDPADLTARDVLGIAPAVAARWTAEQRDAAREVLDGVLTAPAQAHLAPLGVGASVPDAVIASFAQIDFERDADGRAVLGATRVAVRAGSVVVTSVPFSLDGAQAAGAPPLVFDGWDQLEAHGAGALIERDRGAVAAFAAAAGAGAQDTVLVVPAPQEPFGLAYVDELSVVLVNPVVLAVLAPVEPTAGGALAVGAGRVGPGRSGTRARAARAIGADDVVPPRTHTATPLGLGNPYSFYGSVAECAASQRLRCEACLPAGTCEAEGRNVASGNDECQLLAADGGRGYFLLCANVALAITTVAACVTDAGGCSFDAGASDQLDRLEANASFVDDAACGGPLDRCLADLFGESDGNFPELGVDAGSFTPPRDVNVTCGDEPNCDASCDPTCDPSCDCDSSCDDDCESTDDQGNSTYDCEDESGDGSSCDSSCNDCNGTCDGCESDNSSSCGNNSSSCNNCAVRTPRAPGGAGALAVLWAMFPLGVMRWWRARERRRVGTRGGSEGASDAGGERDA